MKLLDLNLRDVAPSSEPHWTGLGFNGSDVEPGLDSQVWIYLFLDVKPRLDPETSCVFYKIVSDLDWTGPSGRGFSGTQ